ncbi:MAG TPA: hypothetical protein PLF76_05890 [Methanomassiliicoccaceae archaeon]|nr:hypothetical protein [Methanomassiliicoccaceae archaeon]
MISGLEWRNCMPIAGNRDRSPLTVRLHRVERNILREKSTPASAEISLANCRKRFSE